MTVQLTSILILWIVTGASTYAQDVIFGSDNDSSSCTTKEGGKGRCVELHKCAEVLRTFLTDPPKHCGFNGFSPIVCCPVTTKPVTEDHNIGTVLILDITPPDFGPDFECGKSAVRTVSDSSRFKRAKTNPGKFDAVNPDLTLLPIAGILDILNQGKKPEFQFKEPVNEPSVIGGIDAMQNAWPWMALLGIREDNSLFDWFCAGALISDQWVLTAAHCVDEKIPNIVRLGEHDYKSVDDALHEDFEILQIIPYPNYRPPVAYHDLALLQLSTKVTFQTYIGPVCLPWGDESQANLTGTQVTLTGWGDTEFMGRPSSILQEVDITMFPNQECQTNYSQLRLFQVTWPNGMGEETACAGDRNGGRDACQGDSGGPIIYFADGKYTLNGVVSRGYGCGHKDFPGIYANVLYQPYLAWIKKTAFGRQS